MRETNQQMDRSIADILEECRQRLALGESIESCLAAYPSYADELRGLLPLVARMQRLPCDPDPAYMAGARRRFRAAVNVARASRDRERAQATSPLNWLRRVIVPIAVVLVMLFSGLGLVQASADALPDSPLYPVQGVSETFGELLAPTSQARAAFQIGVANRRRLNLERAASLNKAPTVQLIVATAMVQRSTQATQQVVQEQGAQRQQLVANLRKLLPAERQDLDPLANSPRPGIALRARELQQQIAADEQQISAQ